MTRSQSSRAFLMVRRVPAHGTPVRDNQRRVDSGWMLQTVCRELSTI